MEDKLPAGDIKQNSPALKWLDNFWYHYKVHTIIVLFVIFVLTVCILQTCRAKSIEDVSFVYAGTYKMTREELEGVRGAFNAAIPEDYNRDGRRYAEILSYQIFSEDQLKEMLDGSEEGHDKYVFYKNLSPGEYDAYSNMLATGEISVCLLEPWLYQKLVDAGRLKPLTDVFGAKPEGSVGEYGVRLGDTALHAYYDALKIIPEETVVCLLQPYVIGASSKSENYEKSIGFFKGIVEFKMPDNVTN